MIVSNGVDIVEIDRVKRILNKGNRFLDKVFTRDEVEYFKNNGYKAESVAGFFAAKEAISKVLGTGIGKISWHEISLYKDENGKPWVKLSGNAFGIANGLGIDDIAISITHDNGQAIAFAIGYGENEKYIEKNFKYINETKYNNSITLDYVKKHITKRDNHTHKGDYGKVGVIAGSKGFTGAAHLSSLAAFKAGSGLVYLLIPESLNTIMEIKTTEVITVPIDDNQNGFFIYEGIDEVLKRVKDYDVLIIGPGLGVDEGRKKIVKDLLRGYKKTIVLDADGLNCLDSLNTLKERTFNTVITPHVGEMSRLLKVDIEKVMNNKEEYAKMVSKDCNIVTVLKDHNTIIDDGTDQYKNTTGNAGMATAGSGDVLAGIIASLIGQGLSENIASRVGVFIHGLAGDIAAFKKGEYGITATDILEQVPYAIKFIIDS